MKKKLLHGIVQVLYYDERHASLLRLEVRLVNRDISFNPLDLYDPLDYLIYKNIVREVVEEYSIFSLTFSGQWQAYLLLASPLKVDTISRNC